MSKLVFVSSFFNSSTLMLGLLSKEIKMLTTGSNKLIIKSISVRSYY